MSTNVLALLDRVRRSGNGWIARCPAHPDKVQSLSIAEGDRQPWLFKCFAGCSTEAILSAIGLDMQDVLAERDERSDKPESRCVATYDYTDAAGNLLFQVFRYEPKSFRQHYPNGKENTRRVWWRLHKLQQQPVVYVVEGEKDVETLERVGITATCISGGASGWKAGDYLAQLQEVGVARVVVLPDNDAPGFAFAQQVADACAGAGIQTKVVVLPGLPDKGDVSDWLQWNTKDQLLARVKTAPLHIPGAPIGATAVKLLSAADLLDMEDTPRKWLVQDRIPEAGVILCAGKPKAGKSTLARFLAYCVASGEPFLGHDVKRGLVWYLAFEDKADEFVRHMRSLGLKRDMPLAAFFGDGDGTKLQGWLHTQAAAQKPALIVVDTLQRFVGAKDLNDYAEMTAKLAPLILLARSAQAAVVLVHHAGKGSERQGVDVLLGSQAIAGSADNIFVVGRDEHHHTLSTIQRIGHDLTGLVLEMNESGRIEGIEHEAAETARVATAAWRAIVDAGAEGLTWKELREVTGGGSEGAATLRRVLNQQLDMGNIGARGDDKEKRFYAYLKGGE